MKKANVSEPITSVSDWKLALQRIFGQDSIIGFNCLQAVFDISLTSNEGCWNDCEAGMIDKTEQPFPSQDWLCFFKLQHVTEKEVVRKYGN